MNSDLQNLPEAQRLDYAPPPLKKRFPWLLLFASPFVATGAGLMVCTAAILTRMPEGPAIACSFGTGLLVFGGMLVLVHLRWK